MIIGQRSRRIGQTMAACLMMLPKLKEGGSAYISGEKYPDNYISILGSLGIEVEVKESYTSQRLEPIYDNLFAIEPQIIGFAQKPKRLTGYILTLKI